MELSIFMAAPYVHQKLGNGKPVLSLLVIILFLFSFSLLLFVLRHAYINFCWKLNRFLAILMHLIYRIVYTSFLQY